MDHQPRGPDKPGPPPYVMLAEHGEGSGAIRPPPHRRNLPRYQSRRSAGGCCGCGCLCWCCCFLVFFIAICAVAIASMYLVFDLKEPTYSFNSLSVSAIDFGPDLLHTRLTVAVQAVNPNKLIGISYIAGNNVIVAHKNTTLGSGHIPTIYQAPLNTTVLNVTVEGKTKYNPALKTTLLGNKGIPLDVRVFVPVSLHVDDVVVKDIKVRANWTLTVDSLSPNRKAGVKVMHQSIHIEF